MSWRVDRKCDNCPFASSGAGRHLRKSLGRARWEEICDGLRSDQHFYCHKTVSYDDDGEPLPGTGKVCAGSLEWSEAHGVSQNFCRVMERVSDMFGARK
jgi:hypothetical protein